MRAALAEAGAGAIGDYDRAPSPRRGGTLPAARGRDPAIGQVGELEVVAEVRIEVVCPRPAPAVVAAMLAAHPYEEPAYDVVELAALGTHRDRGTAGSAGWRRR